MADEIIIETTSQEVITVGVPGPQGPAGAAGTGLETLTIQGDTLYRGAATGERLPIGSAGQVLKVVNGLPAWANESGAVSSVAGRTGAVTLNSTDISSEQALEVYEAGNANCNGFYIYGGLFNGRPTYYATKDTFIYWDDFNWIINHNGEDQYFGSAAIRPWDSVWSLGEGSNPLPVVDQVNSRVFEQVVGQRTNPTALGTASSKNVGTGANDVAAGNDSRFTDARQPLSHASTHHTGGTDAIAPSSIGAAASGAITSSGLTSTGGGRLIGRITAGTGALAEIAVSSPLTFSGGNLGLLSGTIPTASTATPSALGVAAAGTSSNFARADHVHAMPSAADVGAAPATGISPTAITGTAVVDNDARLSDSRTPTAHAASHAAAGSDPLAPSDIGAQSIFVTEDLGTITANVTLTAARAKIYTVTVNTFDTPTPSVQLPTTGIMAGDVVQIRFTTFTGRQMPIRRDGNFFGNDMLNGERRTYIAASTAANSWNNAGVDTHTHAASDITSGTLDIARIPTGTGSTQVSLGDHTHGNINSSGQVGSDSGRVLVTTTAGAVTTLALGTANQVLRTKSDLSGVEFADPSGGGGASVMQSIAVGFVLN
jgi:hypothetical protein